MKNLLLKFENFGKYFEFHSKNFERMFWPYLLIDKTKNSRFFSHCKDPLKKMSTALSTIFFFFRYLDRFSKVNFFFTKQWPLRWSYVAPGHGISFGKARVPKLDVPDLSRAVAKCCYTVCDSAVRLNVWVPRANMQECTALRQCQWCRARVDMRAVDQQHERRHEA